MPGWRLGVIAFTAALATASLAYAQAAPTPPEGAQPEGEAAAPAAPAPPPATAPGPAPEVTPPDQPFKRVVPNFLSDLRRFPSLDTAVVLSLGGIVSAAAYQDDDHYVTHAAAGGTDDVFAAGGSLGNGGVQFGIAIGTYAIGRLNKQPKVAHVGADLIRAQLLSGGLTHGIKLATRRERPTGDQEGTTTSYAFPSGHASAVWTTATVLWRHGGWKIGAPASLLAMFASASRLQENQHYLSDVLFGAALGVASGRTVTMGHGKRRVVATPVALSRGVGVFFTVTDADVGSRKSDVGSRSSK